MIKADEERKIEERFEAIRPFLQNELQRRIFAATEAKVLGYGGISVLNRITGIDREAIRRGLKELEEPNSVENESIRKKGGGRKKSEEIYSDIKEVLEKFLDDNTCDNPESALKWTKKSLHNLEDELNKKGYQVSYKTVHRLLSQMNYSMQGNLKMIEGGSQHADRDEQIKYINKKVIQCYYSEGNW